MRTTPQNNPQAKMMMYFMSIHDRRLPELRLGAEPLLRGPEHRFHSQQPVLNAEWAYHGPEEHEPPSQSPA
jgi:hypothetical protein